MLLSSSLSICFPVVCKNSLVSSSLTLRFKLKRKWWLRKKGVINQGWGEGERSHGKHLQRSRTTSSAKSKMVLRIQSWLLSGGHTTSLRLRKKYSYNVLCNSAFSISSWKKLKAPLIGIVFSTVRILVSKQLRFVLLERNKGITKPKQTSVFWDLCQHLLYIRTC